MRRRTLLASAMGALGAGAVERAAPAFEAYDPAANVWYQILGGDVQSAIVPLPAGLNFTTAGHEAFEVSA